MPNIRVSDDIYERLKGFADKEMRSITNATEYLLSLQLGNATGVPEKTSPPAKIDDLIISEKSEATPQRDKGEILERIRKLEAERDEELRFCQDPDQSKAIDRTYRQRIDPLWAEFHRLKEAK